MNLEQQLRELLTDDRYRLPAWPDAAQRVRAGMRRRRRFRLAIWSALAGALVAVLTPVALLSPAGRPNPTPSVTESPNRVILTNPPSFGQVIPWVDHPAADPGAASPRPAARPCTPADLSPTATSANEGAAGGSTATAIMVTNASTSRCTLLEDLTLVTVDAGGAAHTVPVDPGTAFDDPLTQEEPPTLDPGEAARRTLSTSSNCGGASTPTTYRNLALTFAGTHRIPIPQLVLTATCTVKASNWYRQVSAGPAYHPHRYADLEATISAPATVARGSDLVYRVMLTNSGGAVTFDPCPVFVQRIGAQTESGYLNCTAIEGMPTGAYIQLTMRLRVAADAPTGPSELAWAIQESGRDASGQSATASTTITVE